MFTSSAKRQTARAIAICGGQTSAAKAIGVQRQAVFQWIKNGRVPADKVLILCELVDHQVTPQQLRPDIFGTTATQEA
jgi:DNA-binding transcriptional regulator YdaS (Cro superfamily)